MEKTTFVIIGAAGFLGSAFANYVAEKQCDVFKILRGQISGIESDFHLIAELLKIENKLVVLDFAYTSVPNSSSKDPVKDYSENLYNVIRHLEFVRQLPNAEYVYISSGGTVYGNPVKHEPIREDHSNSPLSPYGITKLASEKYVLMYKEVYGLNVKIVRASNIYGPGQKPFRGQGFVATAIAKILLKQAIQIYGDGSQVRDYLYVEDFCIVLHDVITMGCNGEVYNLGSEIGKSLNEIIEIIKINTGENFYTEYLEARLFDVHYNVLDSSKVSKLNNWSFSTPLNYGIRKTIKWVSELTIN